MAKKKKKQQHKGARRPTYAKGKPVETSGKKKAAVPAKKAVAARAAKPSAKGAGAGGKAAPERVQWNLIKKGTLEQKVFMTLLYIIVVATLLSYPLRLAEARHSYDDAKKELKKWEQKYPTKQEQKKHEKKKPVVPPKPTFGIMLLELFMGAVQGVLFAFLGLNISRRTDLRTPLLDKLHNDGFEPGDLTSLLKYAVPAAVILLIPLAGKEVFADRLFPGHINYPAWKYALSSINDGVQFQLFFVFMIFSALLWLFVRYREKVKIDPHWSAMAGAFIFAVGLNYLNIFGGGRISGVDVTGGKMLALAALFSLPVLVLAYLYWKKGLEYSLLAGVVGFGVYPFLATLFIK